MPLNSELLATHLEGFLYLTFKAVLELLLSSFISDRPKRPDYCILKDHVDPLSDFFLLDMVIMDSLGKRDVTCKDAHDFEHTGSDLGFAHRND